MVFAGARVDGAGGTPAFPGVGGAGGTRVFQHRSVDGHRIANRKCDDRSQGLDPRRQSSRKQYHRPPSACPTGAHGSQATPNTAATRNSGSQTGLPRLKPRFAGYPAAARIRRGLPWRWRRGVAANLELRRGEPGGGCRGAWCRRISGRSRSQ